MAHTLNRRYISTLAFELRRQMKLQNNGDYNGLIPRNPVFMKDTNDTVKLQRLAKRLYVWI